MPLDDMDFAELCDAIKQAFYDDNKDKLAILMGELITRSLLTSL